MDQGIATRALTQARAIAELQWSSAIRIMDGNTALGVARAAEFIEPDYWTACVQDAPQLLITPERARALKIDAKNPVGLDVSQCSHAQIQSLIDGSPHACHEPFVEPPIFAGALLSLAKRGGLLPALLWLPPTRHPDAPAFALESLTAPYIVELIPGVHAQLPIDGCENARIVGFRERYGQGVHLALILGEALDGRTPLVRVHSSCVTGDLLGSLRCDCGTQLHAALDDIKQSGYGILLYLHQEGRGIRINNKLRAYQLQQEGLDTFAANEYLGFAEDERDFSIAANMLKNLEIARIRLLSNNPQKQQSLVAHGIAVEACVPLHVSQNPHNAAYLAAKHRKHGHC